jgi:hypothetical protein
MGAPLTPLHHCTKMGCMRLTVNLETELYALARSLSKAEDCSISSAVNRLLRRSLALDGSGHGSRTATPVQRNGFTVSQGAMPVTAEMIKQLEAEDDEG